MRILLSVPVVLAISGVALAQTPSTPPLGQCRDTAGRSISCGSGAAATDSEAVPLAAKAKVIDDVARGRVPHVASAAPRVVPAHCRDGAYDVGRTRRAACARHAGLAAPRR